MCFLKLVVKKSIVLYVLVSHFSAENYNRFLLSTAAHSDEIGTLDSSLVIVINGNVPKF